MTRHLDAEMARLVVRVGVELREIELGDEVILEVGFAVEEDLERLVVASCGAKVGCDCNQKRKGHNI